MRSAQIVGPCLVVLLAGAPVALAQAQVSTGIKLNAPAKKGGLPVLEALSVRASVRAWSDSELSAQDLSDLLWAANGINRPDKRRTAASAQNAQDVDIYVFMKSGVYLYDAASHALTFVVSGDHRSEIGMPPGGPRAGGPGGAPPAGTSTGPVAPGLSAERPGRLARNRRQWTAVTSGEDTAGAAAPDIQES